MAPKLAGRETEWLKKWLLSNNIRTNDAHPFLCLFTKVHFQTAGLHSFAINHQFSCSN